MTRTPRIPRGFTLLEMAVATAALGMALSAAMYIVIGVNSSAERVRRVGDTQDTARMALDALAAEIRMSGAGVSSGQIGVGTINGAVARIPAIYSGPDITVTTAGGQQVVTNSVYIISSEPGAGVPSSDGTGMQGSVVSNNIDLSKGINVKCTNQLGVQVDCTDFNTFKLNAIMAGKDGLPALAKADNDAALLVGDYVNAVYLRPTKIGSVAGSGANGQQAIEFKEMKIANAYSPDPKAPFGFAQGASIGKARVTHWYVKQVSPGNWQLMRSHPVLDDTWVPPTPGNAAACARSPFVDETSSAALAALCDGSSGGTPPEWCGTMVGSGPVENLQIRYIVDDNITDNAQGFNMWGDSSGLRGNGYHVGMCDVLSSGVPVQKVLREVRLSVVARSLMPDHATNGTTHVKRYGLASWEGIGPTGGALDEYPRRSFEARIVPRNLQGILRL
jgi:prepilin-type N-terminal cleavage/methylation domain-containing protein